MDRHVELLREVAMHRGYAVDGTPRHGMREVSIYSGKALVFVMIPGAARAVIVWCADGKRHAADMLAYLYAEGLNVRDKSTRWEVEEHPQGTPPAGPETPVTALPPG